MQVKVKAVVAYQKGGGQHRGMKAGRGCWSGGGGVKELGKKKV